MNDRKLELVDAVCHLAAVSCLFLKRVLVFADSMMIIVRFIYYDSVNLVVTVRAILLRKVKCWELYIHWHCEHLKGLLDEASSEPSVGVSCHGNWSLEQKMAGKEIQTVWSFFERNRGVNAVWFYSSKNSKKGWLAFDFVVRKPDVPCNVRTL